MKSMLAGLRRRLDKAEAALVARTPARQRGKKQIQAEAELRSAIEQIEQKYHVKGFFALVRQAHQAGPELVEERPIRPYQNNPSRVVRTVRYPLTVSRNHAAIAVAASETGWRIYATNASAERLSLAAAVLTYRDQIVQENIFRRLHGKVLSITPLYLQREDHARGLVQLLTIGARVLALGDYLARTALALVGQELAGV